MKIMTLKMLGLLGITFVGLYGAQEGPVVEPDIVMIYAKDLTNNIVNFNRTPYNNGHEAPKSLLALRFLERRFDEMQDEFVVDQNQNTIPLSKDPNIVVWQISTCGGVIPGTSKSLIEGLIKVVAEKNIDEGRRAELISKAGQTADIFKKSFGIRSMPFMVITEDDVF